MNKKMYELKYLLSTKLSMDEWLDDFITWVESRDEEIMGTIGQTARKPIVTRHEQEDRDADDILHFECRECRHILAKKSVKKDFSKMKKKSFCPNCGTEADWSDYD